VGVLDVIVPQVGLQVVRLGTVIVVVGNDCVISQVTPRFCWSLVVVTVKSCGSLVATVAVAGVRLRPMPEFSVRFMLPVFLVSC
jgi:hypothetical protein